MVCFCFHSFNEWFWSLQNHWFVYRYRYMEWHSLNYKKMFFLQYIIISRFDLQRENLSKFYFLIIFENIYGKHLKKEMEKTNTVRCILWLKCHLPTSKFKVWKFNDVKIAITSSASSLQAASFLSNDERENQGESPVGYQWW